MTKEAKQIISERLENAVNEIDAATVTNIDAELVRALIEWAQGIAVSEWIDEPGGGQRVMHEIVDDVWEAWRRDADGAAPDAAPAERMQ